MNFKKLSKSTLIGFLAFGVVAGPVLTTPAHAEPIANAVKEATAKPEVAEAASTQTSLASPLPKKSYRLTSYFGERCTGSTGAGFWHNAVDLAAPDGTAIYSIAAGTVKSFQNTANGRTGVITVDHGTYKGKKLIASYAHMWNPSKYVKIGQKVKKGQKISEVGSSGISSGPHIHFVININGIDVDPLPFMKSAGVDFTKEATSVRAKPAKPSTCEVYTWAATGLKKSPSNTSKTLMVVPRGSKVIGYTGKSNKGYYKVKDVKTGKIGYMYSETLGQKVPTTRSAPKTSSTTKNVRYTASGTWHMRDYPSVTIGQGGILDTIKRGEFFTTTGKKATGSGYTWYEVKYNGMTGWVPNHGIIKAPHSAPSTKSVPKGYYYTAKGTVALKNYPLASSSKVYNPYSVVKKGVKFTSTGRSNGGYTEVNYGGKKLWAATSYITRTTANFPKLSNTTKNKSYTAKSNQSLMNYPSSSTSKGWRLATVKKNAKVTTTGKRYGNYYQVKYGKTTGWVYIKNFSVTPAKSKYTIKGPIATKYNSGNVKAKLGAPTRNQVATRGGYTQSFKGGAIYYKKGIGATVQYHGAIRSKFKAEGWQNGWLGFPVQDEKKIKGGTFQKFENGSIHWSSKSGAHATKAGSPIQKKWGKLKYENGYLGYPTSKQYTFKYQKNANYQYFRSGNMVIYSKKSGAHTLKGAMKNQWKKIGWERSPLGLPTTDERKLKTRGGTVQSFEGGAMHWSPKTGAHSTRGSIQKKWKSLKWERGRLGYPTSEEYKSGGKTWQNFEGGKISYKYGQGTRVYYK